MGDPAAAFSIPANCEAYLVIRAARATFARKAGQARMFPFETRASLARPACLAQISRTTTKEGTTDDVGALGGQRECIPHRNMRAKLPNYIGQVFECKAGRTQIFKISDALTERVFSCFFGLFGLFR
jgi:hypothetical protein